MDQDQLRALLEDVRSGDLEVDTALDPIRPLPFEDLGFAKVDHHRSLRHGMPEVIFGMGKTLEQISAIAAAVLDKSRNLLITRVGADVAGLLMRQNEGGEYFPASGALRFWR